MSPLTKLLVALHVLLSLMLAAGVVVFVNRVGNLNAEMAKSVAAARTAEASASLARTQVEAERTALVDRAKVAEDQLTAVRAALGTAQQRGSDQAAEAAKQATEAARLAAVNTSLGQSLQASQSAQDKLNAAVTQLRAENDKLVTERAQLNARVSDLTSNLEVTERDRRFVAEQLAQSKSDLEKLAGELERLGYKPQQIVSAQSIVPVRVPAINGIVRDTRNIEGVSYATISVGSSDNVAQGMKFSVIDRDSAQFLGILVVDSVEANEATGRLTGPAVDRIRPGNEVRTQL